MNKIKYLCVWLWPRDDKIKIQRRPDGIVGGSSGACVPFQDIPLRDPFFLTVHTGTMSSARATCKLVVPVWHRLLLLFVFFYPFPVVGHA